MKRLLTTLGLALLTGMAVIAPAHAVLQVDITRGNVEPLPIAIPDFEGAPADTGSGIAQVVSADLERSGLFRPIDKRAFLQALRPGEARPQFANWRAINAQALVSGTVSVQPDGRVAVDFRLWDVFAEQQLIGMRYMADPNNWRRIAHIIADQIYKRLTGEDGYFDTRVVYVSETGNPKMRVKRLAIMDQDGFNHRYLTDGRFMALTPRFSPTSQEITYMSYFNNRPRVYIYNIDSGRQEVLGDFPGMTFAPRFSPDGRKVVMSMAQSGNSEIYSMDLATRSPKRLTSNPAIDTSPSYAPDGAHITFNSDRSGSPQIYVMDADGSNAHRISFGDGKYTTPVWSPRGDLIAFTKQLQGKFYIGVMKTDGSGERLLADNWLVEAPTWAPNGRVLMYFKQSSGAGEVRLWTIDLTGYNERRVTTPTEASDPAWSPLLQ